MLDLEKTIKEILTVYYCKHDIPVRYSPWEQTSYFDPNKIEIVISGLNIMNPINAAQNSGEVDEILIRSLVYHELAHAMWTPANIFDLTAEIVNELNNTNNIKQEGWLFSLFQNILNIVEDELNERFGEHVFLQVDFESTVLKVNGLPSFDGLEDTIDWKSYESVIYTLTRFHKGGVAFKNLFAKLFKVKWIDEKVTFHSDIIENRSPFGVSIKSFIKTCYLAYLCTGYVRFNNYHFPADENEFQDMINQTKLAKFDQLWGNFKEKEKPTVLALYDKVLNFLVQNGYEPIFPKFQDGGKAQKAVPSDDTSKAIGIPDGKGEDKSGEVPLGEDVAALAACGVTEMVNALDEVITKVERSPFYDEVSKAIIKSKGYNNAKEQGGGLGYSGGRLNVNRLAHNTVKPVNDWRVFDKGNRSGKADKKINKFYVTLYLDISGSYSSNVDATNKLISAMKALEVVYKDNFEFDIIKLGSSCYDYKPDRDNDYSIVMAKKKRWSYACDGTSIVHDAEIAIEKLHAQAKHDAKKIFIMLIDGIYDSVKMSRDEQSDEHRAARSLFAKVKKLYGEDRYVIADQLAAKEMIKDGYDAEIISPDDTDDYPVLLAEVIAKCLVKSMS